jgi:hypothetical protein
MVGTLSCQKCSFHLRKKACQSAILSSGDGCAGPDGQSASVYERAMAAFGAIMQFYDPLRSFPLWGFGGQVGHFTYRGYLTPKCRPQPRNCRQSRNVGAPASLR